MHHTPSQDNFLTIFSSSSLGLSRIHPSSTSVLWCNLNKKKIALHKVEEFNLFFPVPSYAWWTDHTCKEMIVWCGCPSSAVSFHAWPYQSCIRMESLTLNTLTSECIFSILFSKHFLLSWQGEFVKKWRVYLVCEH